MRAIPLAACLAGLLTVCALPAAAKTFQLPDAAPAATVYVPDGWKPTEVERGVEATSPDGETYVAFETASAKGLESLISEDIDFLVKQGVKIDPATKKDATKEIGGIPVYFVTWNGTDKDGPTMVTLGIFGINDKLALLMTAWSSPKGDQANGAELTKMLENVKRK